MKNNYLLILFLSFINLPGFSQENIPLETWRVHLSFNETHDLELYADGVIVAAKEGIFISSDDELKTITTLNGLHPSAISAIGYHSDNKILFVGHESGAIDIIKNNEIITITALLNDQRSPIRIHHFYLNENKAYISTDIGIMVYDISSDVFTATYDGLGENGDDIPTYASIVFQGEIFVSTDSGVISGALTGSNLNDFRSWKRYDEIPSFKSEGFAVANDQLFTIIDNADLYSWDGNQWDPTGFFSEVDFEDISPVNDDLAITLKSGVFLLQEGQKSDITPSSALTPKDAVISEQGVLFVADSKLGLVRSYNGEVNTIVPSGPHISKIKKLEVVDQKLYVLPAGLYENDSEGFAVFRSGRWLNYSSENQEFQIPPIENIFDVEQFNSKLYFSSAGDGLMELHENGTTIFKAGDQGIPFQQYGNRTILTGMTVTGEGLWVANYGAQQSLHLYKGSQWISYDLTYDFILDVIAAPEGLLILRLDPDIKGGIVVFDPKTGQERLLNDNKDNGQFPTSRVNDIVFDREGKLWVATSSGIAYLTSLNNIFTSNINAVVPVFNLRYLLRNINVTALAFDGGNRLWAGTDQGVWLFNASLNEEVYYFNENNSPLLSDKIFDLILLQNTGEVFFATENGLISFRSATSTPAVASEKIKVFPNPVTYDFSGAVGISGITVDAIVKITDEAGNLVYQTKANGSTASWDLLNMKGQRVSSGIYLIFTSAADGSDSLVGKLAVIR